MATENITTIKKPRKKKSNFKKYFVRSMWVALIVLPIIGMIFVVRDANNIANKSELQGIAKDCQTILDHAKNDKFDQLEVIESYCKSVKEQNN